jgi:hypothetical protein
MPELDFIIDQTTGELQLHVQGIAGPACEEIAKLARTFLGTPVREEETAEYRLRPNVRPQLRPRHEGQS